MRGGIAEIPGIASPAPNRGTEPAPIHKEDRMAKDKRETISAEGLRKLIDEYVIPGATAAAHRIMAQHLRDHHSDEGQGIALSLGEVKIFIKEKKK